MRQLRGDIFTWERHAVVPRLRPCRALLYTFVAFTDGNHFIFRQRGKVTG
jgi:hypothetical protein